MHEKVSIVIKSSYGQLDQNRASIDVNDCGTQKKFIAEMIEGPPKD